MENKKILRYFLPLIVFGVAVTFMLIYSTAYSPIKPNVQVILCYKFKTGVTENVKADQAKAFQKISKQLAVVADYNTGNVKNDKDSNFDIIHRFTFRSEHDLDTFHKSPEFLELVKNNEANWENQLEIKADLK
ncbi:MAG: Dabb family protein [Bacteroidetes bacterium]|nr:Dabb family protein [Bacteroidota bacterium]